jgi:hypothetical protein
MSQTVANALSILLYPTVATVIALAFVVGVRGTLTQRRARLDALHRQRLSAQAPFPSPQQPDWSAYDRPTFARPGRRAQPYRSGGRSTATPTRDR